MVIPSPTSGTSVFHDCFISEFRFRAHVGFRVRPGFTKRPSNWRLFGSHGCQESVWQPEPLKGMCLRMRLDLICGSCCLWRARGGWTSDLDHVAPAASDALGCIVRVLALQYLFQRHVSMTIIFLPPTTCFAIWAYGRGGGVRNNK